MSMRITNSMMINRTLRDLNTSMTTLNKYSSQLSANRRIVRLSDDPIGVMKSLNARKQIRNIKQYRANIQSANQWNSQVETALSDMNEIIKKIYEETVNAGGVKNDDDKQNIETLIKELRDHLLETVNSSMSEIYIFGGYNATQKPFVETEDGRVLYNGLDLYDIAPQLTGAMPDTAGGEAINFSWGGDMTMLGDYQVSFDGTDTLTFTDALGNTLSKTITQDDIDASKLDMTDIGLGVITWETPDMDGNPPTIADIGESISNSNGGNTVTTGLYATATTAQTGNTFTNTAEINGMTWEGPIMKTGKFSITAQGDTITIKDSYGNPVANRQLTAADIAAQEIDLTDVGLGKIKWTNAGGGPTEDQLAQAVASLDYVTTPLGEESSQNLQFEIGYQLRFDVTFTGISVVGLGEENMFKILDDLIADLHDGIDAGELTNYLSKLQGLQDRVLTNIVRTGARTTRLSTMDNRYEQDLINAEAVRGDIEDIDQAYVIMQYKFAESIYQQALAAGAKIIQPTLMDFLR